MARTQQSQAAPKAAKRKRRAPLRLSDFPWGKIAVVVLVLAAIAIGVRSEIDIETVHARADEFNPYLAFALLLVLPLVGFPASLLHIGAGIRFGAVWGLALVSLSILVQIVASYGIVRIWRKRFERAAWVRKVRDRIPQGAHSGVCVFAVLLPGAPYAGINYVLPLIGVPLRTLLLCAWPLHTLRSTITVILGDQSAQLTATRLLVLVAYALLIVAASWWTYRRLKSQFGDPPSVEDGRKQPA